MISPPLNFEKWIDEHRHLLKPPVGNKLVWSNTEFIVMVVGGPNERDDYHVNQSEEFFHQLEGDIVLKVKDGETFRDIPIREGEIFLLPPKMPHSPQRPEGSVGLVVERRRRDGELDGFQWFCPRCNAKLYEEFFPLTDIVKQLPEVFERFYADAKRSTCAPCGIRLSRKKPDVQD